MSASTPPPEQKLTIAWHMPDPPVSPRDSYTFPADTLAQTQAEAQVQAAAPSPGGPEPAISPAAVAILTAAFRQGLSRYTAWQADGELAADPAFALAASIYKRGVSCPALSSSPSTGQYDIPVVTMASELLRPSGDHLVIVDANVSQHHALPAFEKAVVIKNVSEQIKGLNLVEQLIAAHRDRGRPGHWLIFGGGILCDTAAFAADLVGSTFTLVPTTLLAMADACVGGKTGVNFPPFGKNQLGRFAFPAKVVCCPEFLTSLPLRELRCGVAECLKHALLSGDEPLLDALVNMSEATDFTELLDPASGHLLAVMAVKAKVVAADPGEAGQRATLNFGHTLGHAIEALAHEARAAQVDTTTAAGDLHHGEAVYYGMVFAAILSAQQAGLAAATKDRIIAACQACYPAMSLSGLEAATGYPAAELFAPLMAKVATDKKNIRGAATSQWVLLADFGRCAQSPDGGATIALSETAVAAAWPEYLSALT